MSARTSLNTGNYSFLPVYIIVFAQLIRVPALTYYFYWLYSPHLHDALNNYLDALPKLPPKALLYSLIVITDYIYQIRGTALILKEILGCDIDATVPRTHAHPIAITPLQAYLWIVDHVLCFIATVIWTGLPEVYLWLSLPHALLQAVYSPANRFTDFTPFMIGPGWALGLFTGAAAAGIHPFRGVPWLRSWSPEKGSVAVLSLATLYACLSVVLQLFHEHQDVESDKVAGVRDIRLRFEANARQVVLGPVATLQVALLASTGLGMVAGALYCLVALEMVGVSGSLIYKIWLVDTSVAHDCLWSGLKSYWYAGGGMAMGLAMGYLLKTQEARWKRALKRSLR